MGAASQLFRRRTIRGSFIEWARDNEFEPATHHRLVCRSLEDVATGDCRRLALFLPPGSAKSTYASMLFPPWYLARNPKHAILGTSHTEELAERWGRRARNLIAGKPKTLGINVSDDSRSAGRWELLQGGEYFAAGVGGAIAGRRADLGLIDDWIRNREDAASKTTRDKQWDWWNYDFQPRLKPTARIVLIGTRWHEDDLAGRILEQEGERWRVISIPMVAEQLDDPLGRAIGERLWPDWFTDEMVADARRDSRVWSALYQQRPAPEEGDYFHKAWLQPVASVPPKAELRIYGGSDYAVTDDGGDYTVHAVVGIDSEDRPYLLDLWRKQATSDVWIEAFCDLVVEWKPTMWGEEGGQIRSGVGPFLERRARERRAWVFRHQFASRHDKAVRAQSFRGYISMQGLRYLETAPWRADFENEMLMFPQGRNDDIVDALSVIGQLLDLALKAPKPRPHVTKPDHGYRAVRTGQGPNLKVL